MERGRLSSMACLIFLVGVLVFGSGCQKTSEMDRPIRIAVARFSHETCTFCPKPTTIEDWEYFGPPSRDLLGSNEGYIGGF
ncbi:MAG: hypothetical protein V3V48_11810, partial [Candidatus Aminicenantaceae bacterium]